MSGNLVPGFLPSSSPKRCAPVVSLNVELIIENVPCIGKLAYIVMNIPALRGICWHPWKALLPNHILHYVVVIDRFKFELSFPIIYFDGIVKSLLALRFQSRVFNDYS